MILVLSYQNVIIQQGMRKFSLVVLDYQIAQVYSLLNMWTDGDWAQTQQPLQKTFYLLNHTHTIVIQSRKCIGVTVDKRLLVRQIEVQTVYAQ